MDLAVNFYHGRQGTASETGYFLEIKAVVLCRLAGVYS